MFGQALNAPVFDPVVPAVLAANFLHGYFVGHVLRGFDVAGTIQPRRQNHHGCEGRDHEAVVDEADGVHLMHPTISTRDSAIWQSDSISSMVMSTLLYVVADQ